MTWVLFRLLHAFEQTGAYTERPAGRVDKKKKTYIAAWPAECLEKDSLRLSAILRTCMRCYFQDFEIRLVFKTKQWHMRCDHTNVTRIGARSVHRADYGKNAAGQGAE